MILRWKKLHGLNPSGDSKLCDHFAMVTWEFLWGRSPVETFHMELFCSPMIYVCFKRKKPECIMGSRVSTVIWSWPILTILTKITIFGHWFILKIMHRDFQNAFYYIIWMLGSRGINDQKWWFWSKSLK